MRRSSGLLETVATILLIAFVGVPMIVAAFTVALPMGLAMVGTLIFCSLLSIKK